MNAHVFTTSTSAASGSSTSSWPSRASMPSMSSLSIWFFGQPRVRKWTRFATGRSVAEVRELHREVEVLPAQELHHGLQVVALLARDAHLRALDRRLHLELRVLDVFHDFAGLLGDYALLEIELLLRGAHRPGLRLAGVDGLQRDVPLGQAFLQVLDERAQLEVVLGMELDRVVLAPDLERGAFEVEAVAELALRLVDRVVDLLQIELADDVERGHEAGVSTWGAS